MDRVGWRSSLMWHESMCNASDSTTTVIPTILITVQRFAAPSWINALGFQKLPVSSIGAGSTKLWSFSSQMQEAWLLHSSFPHLGQIPRYGDRTIREGSQPIRLRSGITAWIGPNPPPEEHAATSRTQIEAETCIPSQSDGAGCFQCQTHRMR